jgi:Rrf2 family protein
VLRVPVQVDYALQALAVLAGAAPDPVTGERLAARRDLPNRYLEATLASLRRAGLVTGRRGADGGYRLARAPEDITVADVMLAVEGALVDLRARPGVPTDPIGTTIEQTWRDAGRGLESTLEGVTIADIAGLSAPPPPRAPRRRHSASGSRG